MKVTIRYVGDRMTVYIPKKDLEEKIVAVDPDHVFGGALELEGGMKLFVEPMDEVPRLPITVRARKVE